jgi:hypothetical protein
MSTQYHKGNGALFTNTQKAKDTHPDFNGNVELTPEQMHMLFAMMQAGQVPKLKVSGWWRVAKTDGQTYLSMQTEAYMKPEEQQYPPQVQPQYAPQPPQAVPPQPVPAPPAPQQYAPQVPPQPVPQVPAPQPQQQAYAQPAPVDDFDDQDIPF